MVASNADRTSITDAELCTKVDRGVHLEESRKVENGAERSSVPLFVSHIRERWFCMNCPNPTANASLDSNVQSLQTSACCEFPMLLKSHRTVINLQ